MDVLESGVQICVPYTKPFMGAFVDSLLYTWKPKPLYWKRLYGQGVDVARNSLIKNFLDSPDKPRFLMFIDNDATWDGEAIKRLMEHDLPMVCGCMYTRSLPPTPTMGRYVGPTKEGKEIYAFSDVVRGILAKAEACGIDEKCSTNALCLPQDPTDLVERDGVGLHFTMIRRDVLETVKPPWCIMGGETGAGEDLYLSKKVRDAGFPIYTDLSIHTGHLVGEDKDFGLVELLAWVKYVDQSFGVVDDHSRWEVEVKHDIEQVSA
jgi:hypothetical protein